MTGHPTSATNRRLGCCLFRFVVTVFTILLTYPLAADTIVLDDFSTSITGAGVAGASGTNFSFDNLGGGEYELSLIPNGTVSWSDTGPGIFGGTRKVTMAKTGGTSPTSAKIFSGVLEVGHPTNDVPLSVSLEYNSTSVAFDQVDLLVVNMQSVDAEASESVFPTLTLHNGTTSAEKSFLTPLTVGSNILTLSSLFQALNSRNVTRVTLSMTAQTGADFKINSLLFTPTPEPSGIAICLTVAAFCCHKLHRRTLAHRARKTSHPADHSHGST